MDFSYILIVQIKLKKISFNHNNYQIHLNNIFSNYILFKKKKIQKKKMMKILNIKQYKNYLNKE